MQKAALKVMEVYHGKLPADYEALKSLPGIGNYTAGAIASIAYGIPVPAVDGNVLRVIARIREDDRDIMKQSVRNQVEADLLAVMPQDDQGTFNQALMGLGPPYVCQTAWHIVRNVRWQDTAKPEAQTG